MFKQYPEQVEQIATNFVVPITLPKTNDVKKLPVRVKNKAALLGSIYIVILKIFFEQNETIFSYICGN